MSICRLRLSALVAALLPAFCAGAAQPSHQCAQLTDDVLRLACYDAAFGKPRAPAPEVAAPVAAAPVAPAAPAVAPAPPAAAPAIAAERPARAAEPAQAFTATVQSVRRTADRRLAVTLDNGQVWMQLENIDRLELEAGDQVTIRPGAFNSFTLRAPDGLLTKVRLAP